MKTAKKFLKNEGNFNKPLNFAVVSISHFLRKPNHIGFSQGSTTCDIRCDKMPWYLADILDIRLLDSVETWLLSAIFQVFYCLTTAYIWLLFCYIQQFFFKYSAEICQILNWSQFSVDIRLLYILYPADTLISWYSVYRFLARCSIFHDVPHFFFGKSGKRLGKIKYLF